MRMGHRKSKMPLLLGIMMLLVNACGSTAPSRYYLLNPLQDVGASAPAAAAAAISVALLPVQIPEYLNRSQMVTRQGGHQIKLDEFNRWAEPLDTGIASILAANLSLLLATDTISVLSRPKQVRYDYRLAVDVTRFDGRVGGEALLICRWTLFKGEADIPADARRSRFMRALNGDEYEDLAAALSLLLADLSREIADRILHYEKQS